MRISIDIPPPNGFNYEGMPECLALSKQEEFEKKHGCKLKFIHMNGIASVWEKVDEKGLTGG